ncbi:hypothetical protein GLOTRDRAFT_78210 [Gloeophyllum trabeum ATCC 11539]|uniref:MYND-type domain-containing protein n=1 Tax=Gloeophyllum trabeum (strain ATCC 11539 / FP-39264 / Madison 617) TaxID=670483 RepID=S7Q2P9_GLOTA|nr:uncharacterized protein GLOTRDRAFT_78210 [Gloeophyllum trabeum ATCC 11539]EPQ54266.1 hypothetical protein GLOTRDRAFT_78210 [Gloeophyllum trabeum ATCC 11539]
MASTQGDPPHIAKQSLRCNYCYASREVKRLQKCSRCKAMAYCSKECQKADWKSHKQACSNNNNLAKALKEHADTPLGILESLILPDGISLYELDKRLEKWVKFHSNLMMWATVNALDLYSDISLSRKQVLYIKLEARRDHDGSPGKYFRATDAYPVDVEDAKTWPAPWPESLDQVRQLQDESESMNRGSCAAAMVECKQLAVQTVPFGSLKNLKGPRLLNWKEELLRDIENGIQPHKYRR